jgi:chromosomal replication initiation ATPase DnaA
MPVAVDLVVAPPPRVHRTARARPAPREIAPSRRRRATRRAIRSPRPIAQREFPYRFDNFVVGSCNALAREASLAVARSTPARAEPARARAGAGSARPTSRARS